MVSKQSHIRKRSPSLHEALYSMCGYAPLNLLVDFTFFTICIIAIPAHLSRMTRYGTEYRSQKLFAKNFNYDTVKIHLSELLVRGVHSLYQRRGHENIDRAGALGRI